jgi:hypothetical protein
MPRRVLSLEEKLENAIKKKNTILSKYNHNRLYLNEKRYEYSRTKDARLKTIWRDVNKLRQTEKSIRDLEKIINEKEDEDDNNNNNITKTTSSLPQDQGNCYSGSSAVAVAVAATHGNSNSNDSSRDSSNRDSSNRDSSRESSNRESSNLESSNRESINLESSNRESSSRESSGNIRRHQESDHHNNNNDISDNNNRESDCNSDNDNSEDNDQELQNECHNCHRKNHPSILEGSFYCVQFHIRSSSNIARRRPFKHVQFNQTNPVNYVFCTECNTYLDPNNTTAKYDPNVWCSFIWYLLTDSSIQTAYGHQIWRFIPMEWRPWWIDSTRRASFPTITMIHPAPIFKDKTIDIKEWNEDINSFLLSRLASASNKFLRPSIKCPWGCSEFQHKVGYLPLDIMFQRLLQKTVIKVYTKSRSSFEKRVISIREDYICDETDEQDCWFFNPEWQILPSVSFVTGRGPVILTCNEHNNGTNLFMIHPCRWQHNLSSKQPDQLCQAVIQPRIIKPIKASKYSIGFQMFQQSGSFNGIDTCSATSYGKFDFNSKLIRESEARSITNRPDINFHLSKLREENIISKYAEEGRRSFASSFSSSIDYSRLTKGATYISLESSIILQNENSNRTILAWIDYENDRPSIQVSFKKYWSDSLYPCQNMSDYGVRFSKVPILQHHHHNTRLIWKVGVLLSRVESLWRLVSNYYEFRTLKWHGWMLAYLFKNCFNVGNRRQSPADPFKCRSIDIFKNKVQRERLSSYFNDPYLPEVHFIDLPTDFHGEYIFLMRTLNHCILNHNLLTHSDNVFV